MQSIAYKTIINILSYIKKAHKKHLPVGAAIISNNGQITYSLDNSIQHCEQNFDPSLYYGSTIIVNLEPCPSCLFFLCKMKVKKIIFGAYNYEYGACGGRFHLINQIKYYKPKIIGGINHKSISHYISLTFKKLVSH